MGFYYNKFDCKANVKIIVLLMQCLVIHGIQVSPCVINHILIQTCEKYTEI